MEQCLLAMIINSQVMYAAPLLSKQMTRFPEIAHIYEMHQTSEGPHVSPASTSSKSIPSEDVLCFWETWLLRHKGVKVTESFWVKVRPTLLIGQNLLIKDKSRNF